MDCNLSVIIFTKHKIAVIYIYYYVYLSALWDTHTLRTESDWIHESIRSLMVSKQNLSCFLCAYKDNRQLIKGHSMKGLSPAVFCNNVHSRPHINYTSRSSVATYAPPLYSGKTSHHLWDLPSEKIFREFLKVKIIWYQIIVSVGEMIIIRGVKRYYERDSKTPLMVSI